MTVQEHAATKKLARLARENDLALFASRQMIQDRFLVDEGHHGTRKKEGRDQAGQHVGSHIVLYRQQSGDDSNPSA